MVGRFRHIEWRVAGGVWDLCFVLVAVVYAMLFWLGRWRFGWPFVDVGGDSANILSWAVAISHPELFANDAALSDPSALRYYATVHVPLIRWLGPMVGDYGVAWIALLVPHVVLQLVGFYVLGRVMFGHRGWAIMLAVVTLPEVRVNFGTYWGLHPDPQPRFTFQALLPFVLALAVQWRDRPQRWPWLMGLAGLLVYVHPVSAPSWAFAIWLGLWAGQSRDTTPYQRLAYRASAALVFLAAAFPFLSIYGSSQVSVGIHSDVSAAVEAGVGLDFTSLHFGLWRFFADGLLPLPRLLYVAAAPVAIVLLFVLAGRHRARVWQVLLWLIGVVVVAVGLTGIDQWYSATYGVPRFQHDLIRALRFAIPFVLLFDVWALAVLHERLRRAERPLLRQVVAPLVFLVGLAVVAVWVQAHSRSLDVGRDITAELGKVSNCWQRTGSLVCLREPNEKAVTLQAIRDHTPAGATLIASERGLAPFVRWYSRRPIVDDYRDLGVYLYVRRGELAGWLQRLRRRRQIQRLPERGARFDQFVAFARENGADFALLDLRHLPPGFAEAGATIDGYEVVWRSRSRGLLRTVRSDSS